MEWNQVHGRWMLAWGVILLLGWNQPGWTQDASPPSKLVNGGLEDGETTPTGWGFVPGNGGEFRWEEAAPFEGSRSGVIDTTGADLSAGRVFSNLLQTLDAQNWRGKRVRFRAQVKTDAQAQLWLRVDREDKNTMGAFDNMQDRPIRSSDWQPYEIVLDVDEDALQIVAGMFVVAQGTTWIDSIELEEVDDSVATTAMKIQRPQIAPEIMAAMRVADQAPQQPFWNHWLWLVLITLVLFALSGWPAVSRMDEVGGDSHQTLNPIAKFAVRFSVAYWLLYCLPQPLTMIPWVGPWILQGFQWTTDAVVTWTAASVLGIEGELVPAAGNGSGDTTFAYVQLLDCFVLALVVAGLWSLIDRRKQTDLRHLKDGLRIYLRYVLAITMLGYGLAKVTWVGNQFPALGEYQLNKTWGNSSPMNVVWSWMGASHAYTMFAGSGEVLGALLLLWRRTTALGALVVFGVMTNVFMLNMCYDVPVKQYSFHLVVMALFLLLPEMGRLASILMLNRPTEPVELGPSFRGLPAHILMWAVKLAVLVMAFGIPIWNHVDRNWKFLAQEAPAVEADDDQYLLTSRGFRWINEVPFNR